MHGVKEFERRRRTHGQRAAPAVGRCGVLVIAVSGTLAVACVTDRAGGDPTAEHVIAEHCEKLCKKHVECGEASLLSRCAADCRRDPVFDRLSPAWMIEMGGCFPELSCNEFYAAGWDECSEQASQALVPTEACTAYCDSYVYSTFECGYRAGLVDLHEECLGWACFWATGVLTSAADCHELSSCEERVGCESSVFDP